VRARIEQDSAECLPNPPEEIDVTLSRSGTEHKPLEPDAREAAERQAEDLEDGSLDPDELTSAPAWWDEGSDDET
jgi:hypothetical protein